MALSASTVWEVRRDGADTNGGAFVTGASGNDRTQQAAAWATLSVASVVNGTTTIIDVAVGDYTVTTSDVGNILQITGGTATAGFYHITAVNVGANQWTVDRAAGAAGATVVGAMGGGLASLGKAVGAAIASNSIWWKHSATTYDITTSTANVSEGRIAPAVAGLRIEGYETTRGDLSTNKPTLKATVNSITMFTTAGATGHFGNFILDPASATSILPMATGAGTTTHRVSVLQNASTTASFSCGSGSFLLLCEATGGTVAGFRMNGCTLDACVARAVSGFGFESAASHNTCIDCIADSLVGNAASFTNTGASSRLFCINCNAYGAGVNSNAHGFNNPGVAHSMACVNGISDSNVGTGFTGNATHIFNSASRNNGTNFGANAIEFNTVTLSGSPFVNAPFHDFALNDTAGAGADAREAGIPGTFPTTISTIGYRDIGATQHQGDGSSGTTENSVHVLLTFPNTWAIT